MGKDHKKKKYKKPPKELKRTDRRAYDRAKQKYLKHKQPPVKQVREAIQRKSKEVSKLPQIMYQMSQGDPLLRTNPTKLELCAAGYMDQEHLSNLGNYRLAEKQHMDYQKKRALALAMGERWEDDTGLERAREKADAAMQRLPAEAQALFHGKRSEELGIMKEEMNFDVKVANDLEAVRKRRAVAERAYEMEEKGGLDRLKAEKAERNVKELKDTADMEIYYTKLGHRLADSRQAMQRAARLIPIEKKIALHEHSVDRWTTHAKLDFETQVREDNAEDAERNSDRRQRTAINDLRTRQAEHQASRYYKKEEEDFQEKVGEDRLTDAVRKHRRTIRNAPIELETRRPQHEIGRIGVNDAEKLEDIELRHKKEDAERLEKRRQVNAVFENQIRSAKHNAEREGIESKELQEDKELVDSLTDANRYRDRRVVNAPLELGKRQAIYDAKRQQMTETENQDDKELADSAQDSSTGIVRISSAEI
jgi:hypothetical protein